MKCPNALKTGSKCGETFSGRKIFFKIFFRKVGNNFQKKGEIATVKY
jgi:hypothetical protein